MTLEIETPEELVRRSRMRQLVQGGSHGYWRAWQEEKIEAAIELPGDHWERFNMFITEQAAVMNNGEYHLHAFYRRGGYVDWRVASRGSVVCQAEGRCIKVRIERHD